MGNLLKLKEQISGKLDKFIKESRENDVTISEKLKEKGINLTAQTIGNYRRNERSPDIATLSVICDIINITLVDLMPNASKQRTAITKQEIISNSQRFKDDVVQCLNNNSRLKRVDFIDSVGFDDEAWGKYKIKTNESTYLDVELLHPEYRDKDLFAMIVKSDAMSPYACANDVVIFSSCALKDKHFLLDGKFVIQTTFGVQLKLIKFLVSGKIAILDKELRYSDPIPPQNIYDLNDNSFKIIGKVLYRLANG